MGDNWLNSVFLDLASHVPVITAMRNLSKFDSENLTHFFITYFHPISLIAIYLANLAFVNASFDNEVAWHNPGKFWHPTNTNVDEWLLIHLFQLETVVQVKQVHYKQII
jgi:hypothetical protein